MGPIRTITDISKITPDDVRPIQLCDFEYALTQVRTPPPPIASLAWFPETAAQLLFCLFFSFFLFLISCSFSFFRTLTIGPGKRLD